jgi:hypothetical protein
MGRLPRKEVGRLPSAHNYCDDHIQHSASWPGVSGNIVILLLDPEAVPGILFRPDGIGDVNLYRKSIDKSLMLYGKWLSNIISVNDKVVLKLTL